ncbi:MAG: hypothetical protein ACK56W_13515 [Pirellula sp.]|jgi:hypothetical protein|nr:triose-phosphate isomerase [Pirellula sp.]
MRSRPFIVAVLFAGDTDPPYQIYGQAYGIEMQVDSDWNADIILLTSPELLKSITKETEVTGEDAKIVSAGIINLAKDAAGEVSLLPIEDIKNNWLLVGHDSISCEQVSIRSMVQSASEAGCRVILCVNAADVESAHERIAQCNGVSLKDLVVILQAADAIGSDVLMDLIQSARSVLGDTVTSLRFGVEISEANAKRWTPSEHVCGVFVVGESHDIFCRILDIARDISDTEG